MSALLTIHVTVPTQHTRGRVCDWQLDSQTVNREYQAAQRENVDVQYDGFKFLARDHPDEGYDKEDYAAKAHYLPNSSGGSCTGETTEPKPVDTGLIQCEAKPSDVPPLGVIGNAHKLMIPLPPAEWSGGQCQPPSTVQNAILGALTLDLATGPEWPTTTPGAFRTIPLSAMIRNGILWTAKFEKHWQVKVGTYFPGARVTEGWAWLMILIPRHPTQAECEAAAYDDRAGMAGVGMKPYKGWFNDVVRRCMAGEDMFSHGVE